MSNVVYEDRMYNEEVKNQYLSLFSKATQKPISRAFKVSRQSEEDLGKDLYEFSREQIRRLLFLFQAKTEYSSRQNATQIQNYIEWCIDEGYTTGLNPLEGTDKEWKEQFVNKSIKKYWTKKEIDKIINSRVNAQDGATIILPFEGVRGTANSELLNLTRVDVDSFNCRLHLYDDIEQTRRTIPVSEQCIKICEQALREDSYEKMNGNASKDIKSPMANLVSNSFVLKSSVTRTDHTQEAEKNLIHRRLSNIADEIGEPNFTPLNLIYSGMIHYANEIYKQTGKLEAEEYQMICTQFNVNLDQSLQRLKSEFLNVEFIVNMHENES